VIFVEGLCGGFMKQQCKIRNRCLLRVSGEALVKFVEGLRGGFIKQV
jgi:hypothetical protein